MKKPATRARSGFSVITVPRKRGKSKRVRPASWAVIITAVSKAVAIRPKTAQPAQSTLLSLADRPKVQSLAPGIPPDPEWVRDTWQTEGRADGHDARSRDHGARPRRLAARRSSARHQRDDVRIVRGAGRADAGRG